MPRDRRKNKGVKNIIIITCRYATVGPHSFRYGATWLFIPLRSNNIACNLVVVNLLFGSPHMTRKTVAKRVPGGNPY